MSSPPTNPYKSRLLNLINRQSLRLKEQLNRTGRHLKIAVEMGVQILIYPLYLLVQSGRLAQRQLKQKIQQQQVLPPEFSSQPQEVTCDQPLEQILESLESWISQGQDNISPSAVSPPLENISLSVSSQKNLVIRGLATLLQNQKLVLVSSENLLIDIFAPTQQKQLKKRIYCEIANYKYQRRFQERAAKKFPSLIPSFQINSPNVVPPVRWFWTAMRWIQTSQVAIAINLFGESTFIRPRPSKPVREKTNLMTTGEALDNHTNLNSIQDLIGAAIEYFFGTVKSERIENQNLSLLNSSKTEKNSPNLANLKTNPQQTIQLTIQKSPNKITPKSASPTLAEPDPFQIQVLIQAAIDYFFGLNKKQGLLFGNKETVKAELSQRKSQPFKSVPEPDPWLTWDDLFSQENKAENVKIQTDIPVKPSAKLPASKIPVKAKKTFLEEIKPNIPQPEQNKSNLIKREPKSPSKSLAVGEKTSTTIESTSPQTNQLEATPEWIETEATPMGYVKHPLVKILEVLDLIIYWLEKLWLRFWNWLKQKI